MTRWVTVAALLVASVGAFAAAPDYPVRASTSSVIFEGRQQGERFTANLRSFDAKIRYAADDLPGSAFDVTLQLRSIDSRNAERDQAMGTPDWFDVARYPVATFRTMAFRSTPSGVVADADLTIRGRTKRIVFPFTFVRTPNGATLDARVALDRLDFGLGAGEWSDDSMVAHRVDVTVHLTLDAPSAPATAPKKSKK
jgi:polyisoprenoid-binding protein YceI